MKLTSRPFVLDGGTGHELKCRLGLRDGTFHDVMRLNEGDPASVESVHIDFIRAGCHAITTNNFVLTRAALTQRGIDLSRLAPLTHAALSRARNAALAFPPDHRPLVLGSLPPLGAECYHASLVSECLEQLVEEYVELATMLTGVHGGVDVLLAETLSTTREACAVVRATRGIGVPLWVCWTIEDVISDHEHPPRLRSGELLADAVLATLSEARFTSDGTPEPLSQAVGLVGVGLNCAAPRAISSALPFLKEALSTSSRQLQLIAYGNAFKVSTSEWLSGGICAPSINIEAEYDADGLILPSVYCQYAAEWVAGGVDIVGGCCGCSPRVMSSVVSRLIGIE